MKKHHCPICETRPVEAAYAPFCSRRCADVDLQRWLAGVYVVPAEAGEADPEAPPGPDDED